MYGNILAIDVQIMYKLLLYTPQFNIQNDQISKLIYYYLQGVNQNKTVNLLFH